MTDLELMKWYKEYWAKKFPDNTLCELETLKSGEIVLRVNRPSWKTKTYKQLNDAKFAYEKEHNANFTKSESLNLKVKLPFNTKTKAKKEYKTISACIDLETYNKVKAVCDKHNMSMHELIKTLLDQVINESK